MVVEAIVKSLVDLPGLLEIGPGPGVLTSPLSELSQGYIAFELDSRMIGVLKESAPKADVRQADALQVDLLAALNELPSPRGVVSNLPYYITGPLLNHIASAKEGFSRAVLMMQKEVGMRITAKPESRERGSFSVYLQSQFEITVICEVPPDSFLPPPKVDSMVLQFVPKPGVPPQSEDSPFFRMVRMGFAQPRKTLANNLVAGFHLSRDEVEDALEQVGLTLSIRPHFLTEQQWRLLFDQIPAAKA